MNYSYILYAISDKHFSGYFIQGYFNILSIFNRLQQAGGKHLERKIKDSAK